MDEDFGMHENVEETLARLVAGLSPESYERYAPGLQELGLALAQRRQVQAIYSAASESLERAREDMDRAKERAQNALRLFKDGL
jgi:hypothetical protein